MCVHNGFEQTYIRTYINAQTAVVSFMMNTHQCYCVHKYCMYAAKFSFYTHARPQPIMLKGQLKWKFHFLFYYLNVLI